MSATWAAAPPNGPYMCWSVSVWSFVERIPLAGACSGPRPRSIRLSGQSWPCYVTAINWPGGLGWITNAPLVLTNAPLVLTNAPLVLTNAPLGTIKAPQVAHRKLFVEAFREASLEAFKMLLLSLL